MLFSETVGLLEQKTTDKMASTQTCISYVLEVGSPDPGPSRLGGLYTVAFRSAWEEGMGRASSSSCYNSTHPIPRAHLMEPSSPPNAPNSKYHPTVG